MTSWLAEDLTDSTDEPFSSANLLMVSKKRSPKGQHQRRSLSCGSYWRCQERQQGEINLDANGRMVKSLGEFFCGMIRICQGNRSRLILITFVFEHICKKKEQFSILWTFSNLINSAE